MEIDQQRKLWYNCYKNTVNETVLKRKRPILRWTLMILLIRKLLLEIRRGRFLYEENTNVYRINIYAYVVHFVKQQKL